MPSDLRSLTAVNCEFSTSFFTSADGTGAYFGMVRKQSFAFINFETEAQTELELEEFKTIEGRFFVFSAVLIEQRNSSSREKTVFVGLVQERKSAKLFCVLFCADICAKAVSVLDEVDTGWLGGSFTYLMKTKAHKLFGLTSDTGRNTLSVSEILVTALDKLELKTVAHHNQLSDFTLWPSPFANDQAVFYFPSGKYDTLIILPFHGTKSSCMSLSTSSEFPAERSVCPAFSFKDDVWFCSNDETKTIIWSLNMKLLRWSCQAEVPHHCRNTLCFKNLQVLPDSSALLHISRCGERECDYTSHTYQFDPSSGKKYQIGEKQLGKGGFGTVFEGQIDDQRTVAVKVIHDLTPAVEMERNRKILLSAIAEARKLKMLAHRNIVKGYGFKVEETRILLFMELMTESVRQKIDKEKEKRINEKEAFRILHQVLEGLVYLHTLPKPIVHRDIKCGNILLDDNGAVKLGDFGLVQAVSLNTAGSTDLALALNETKGTKYWEAPEVIVQGAVYGRQADVWSVGCSLVEMLTGFPPYFCSLSVVDWAVRLTSGTLSYHPQQLVPGASRHVITILEKCFRRQIKRNVDAVNEITDNQVIRPHSWDLLADVVSVNELETIKAKMKTLENEAEMVRTRIKKLRRFGEQGISFRFGELEEITTSG